MKKSVSAILLAAFFASAAPAFAVIEAKNPLTNVCKVSQMILTAKISAINEDGSGFTIAGVEAIKGAAPGETIAIVAPEKVTKLAAKDAPIIFFSQGSVAIVHVDDDWYLAKKTANGFTITGPHANGARDTFPGRTPALVEATRELIKTGKSPLIDVLKERPLNGEERVVQKLAGIKDPTSFVAGDINGDGKADFIVCSAGGVRLFVSDGASYVHATEKFGLNDVKGKKAELYSKWLNPQEDLNVAIGIIVDGVEYELSNGKFAKAIADKATHYRVKQPGGVTALGNFGDTDDVYQMEVSKEGVTRVKHNTKETAADSVRLTGGKITEFTIALKENGFVNPQATAIDANGDGKADLFIKSDGGNLLLLNRGFGTFLVEPQAAGKLTHAGLLSAGTLDPKSKRESLLTLTADGTIYAIDTSEQTENH